MSQKVHDGIIVDSSVYIEDDRKKDNPVTIRLIQYVAIVIAIWSSLSVLMDTLGTPANKIYINLAILVTAGITFGLCLYRSYHFVKLFFGVLFYGLFFISRIKRITNAFFIIENLVIDKIYAYYGYQLNYYNADYTRASEDITLLLILFLIPLTLLITVSMIKNRLIAISGLVQLLLIAVSFIFGIIPAERYLFAYIITTIYMIKSGDIGHSKDEQQRKLMKRISSRAAAYFSVMGIALFLLMKLIVTPQQYEKVEEIAEIKSEIQTTLSNLTFQDITQSFSDIKLPGHDTSVGGLDGGELGSTGRVEFHNIEQLRVTAPVSSITEGIYLKGYVGSVYTGDSWERHSKEDRQNYKELLNHYQNMGFEPINQVNGMIDELIEKEDIPESEFSLYNISRGKMYIDYQSANKKFLYAPYFTDYELIDGVSAVDDLYILPNKKNSNYEVEYYFNFSMNNIGLGNFLSYQGLLDSTVAEKSYRDYVYKTYTKLPEEGLERLKKDFTLTQEEASQRNTIELIAYVKAYLESNTQYSLSPGKLPKGEDFVEYFLYENHLGYCAHYASAAALMLRAMGVPTRYVEGYTFNSKDIIQDSALGGQSITVYDVGQASHFDVPQAQVAVKDYNAHAWVEVYIDYCGWLPVEFTPGSSMNNTVGMVEDMSEFSSIMAQKEEEAPDTTEVTPSPTPTVAAEKEEPTPAPQELTTQDKLKEQSSKASEKHNDVIFFLLLIILVFGAGILWLYMRIRKNRYARMNKSKNIRALYLFKDIEKLLLCYRNLPVSRASLEDCEEHIKDYYKFVNQEQFQICMDIARKARFGNRTISPSELSKVEELYRDIYVTVYSKLSSIKRLYLRILLEID
ncbi:transglutaminase domain-containing protein [Lachnospiraceae bacterium MD1]|uniref:Transglutaminase domain-containing protein n=1 Tax=Variimorphobacter saccharofermentans TaxID=2755051 RepID=A0A839JUY9_9FIRM|nr:transglutaminase-like domain-containing protein [Variimorphobacter saccharofermentans]MBB2181495.1 transglutaminase domain-containing protein [Variimorphobacter saccharofermentans]